MTQISPQIESPSDTDTYLFGVLSRHWPLWLALGALWISTAILQYLAAARTAGHLIYTLDDAYIHMAMAKNLALHGVYGVTRYEFSSSSSSPLWTLLLALFDFIVGVHDSLPLVLELVISSLVLVAAYVLVKDTVRKQIPMALMLLAVVFFTPLPLLISTGMEHPLHILFAIMFLWFSANTIVDDAAARKTSTLLILCSLCVALVLTRFESYALVFVVIVLLIIRSRWKIALGLALSSIVPLFVYQAISVAHGWRWLPNSILVRGNIQSTGMFNSIESIVVVPWKSPDFWKYTTVAWEALLSAPYLVVLIGGSLLLLAVSWKRSRQVWKLEHVVLIVYAIAALAHLQFGRLGFFFRYDAYLVSLGIFVLAIGSVGLFDALKQWMATNRTRAVAGGGILLLAIQLPIPLLVRSFLSIPLIPLASQNIYEQQYQMGLFLKQHYEGKTVAANDVGAICYLADIHLVDLVGLASADIYQLREANEFAADRVLRLCDDRNVSIAIAYEIWLEQSGLQELRRQWKKIGMWKIEENIVCGSNIVTFFAVGPSEEEPLVENLRTFSRTLPHGVGYWVRSDIPPDTSKTRRGR